MYGLECPPAWGLPRRPDWPTLGGRVCQILDELGTPPMPHQRYIVDVALELDPDTGGLWYRNVGLSIMRQQGKTQTILGAMGQRLAAWTRQRIIYAAQDRNHARKRWEDEFVAAFEAAPRLAPHVRVRKTNGNEALIWRPTRSMLGITSNTESAGHGPPLDMGVIDEAFRHEDDRLEQAMSPAMITRWKYGQLWWASAGGTERSVWLNKKRAAGRELVQRFWADRVWPRTAYFEWFSASSEARTDRAVWHRCMPALCPDGPPCRCAPGGKWRHTVFESTIAAELESMDPAEFDRAYLNRTRRHVPVPDVNVPTAEWPELADVGSRPGPDVVLALEIGADRKYAAVGIAGLRVDGLIHLELIHEWDDIDGPELARWLAKRRVLHNPVAIAVMPNCAILTDLEKAGITKPVDVKAPARGDLWVPSWAAYADACAQMTDACRPPVRSVRHIDQPELNAAVAATRSKAIGDGFGWLRRGAGARIAGFVAVTLARAGLLERIHLVQEDEVVPVEETVWIPTRETT